MFRNLSMITNNQLEFIFEYIIVTGPFSSRWNLLFIKASHSSNSYIKLWKMSSSCNRYVVFINVTVILHQNTKADQELSVNMSLDKTGYNCSQSNTDQI